MSESESGNGNREGERGGGFLKSLAERILVPLAAAAASAAAGYVARNAPRLIEEKLLPKLRTTSLPVVGEASREGQKRSSKSNGRARASASTEQREHARAERAARRDERKHAASTTNGREA
jgi:malic enzyme